MVNNVSDFKKFSSIEGLHQVIKGYRPGLLETSKLVTFLPKIKLHGTNAGIRVYSADETGTCRIKAMKRSGYITPDNDNAGFAKWVECIDHLFDENTLEPGENAIIWGEWVGPGIQKGTSLNNLPYKAFAIFKIELFTFRSEEPIADYTMPHEIHEFFAEYFPLFQLDAMKDVFILPFERFEYIVDIFNREHLLKMADDLNARVAEVDKVCPWVKRNFGVEGPGEGYVMYAYDDYEGDFIQRLTFKAKGEAHQVVKNRAPVVLDPEKVASYSEFANKFVTDGRCEQALSEIGGLDIKNMGPFLKWIGNDIIKESVDELAASGMEWKDVAKSVTAKASTWFKDKVRSDF